MKQNLPIGVFDSGVGGLTVLKQLQQLFPSESFVYLGDTARLPYGTKGHDTITQYALQATSILLEHQIKALVVACNTASAIALQVLQSCYRDMPILGVIIPGATAAIDVTRNNTVAVIATEATINAKGYFQALNGLKPGIRVIEKSCSLFVALAEEGWHDNDVVDRVAHIYLDEIFSGNAAPDTLVLGCTHFPILHKAISRVVGNAVTIVDSAHSTAYALKELLVQHNLLTHANNASSDTIYLVTDSPSRFKKVAVHFLDRVITDEKIFLVDSAKQHRDVAFSFPASSSIQDGK